MEDKAYKLINLLEKELTLYEELFFNEMDKGCLLYQHEIDSFNKKNEYSSVILSEIGLLIEDKKEILENYKNILNIDDVYIELIIQKFIPEKLDYYKELKPKLQKMLKHLSELNLKNKIILDTTYSVSKIMLEGLKRENIYNDKGSLCDSYFSTVKYSV